MTVVAAWVTVGSQPADFGWFEERLVQLFDLGPLAPAWALLALLAAALVGALHGVGPGHGKAVAAAYLAGGRGRPRDAVALGAIVSLMHTGSVLAVGLALGALSRSGGGQVAFMDAAGGWLRVVAGALVAAVGVGMLLRARGDHGHHHSELEALRPAGGGVSPLSRQGVLLIGASGGLLPSPAAFLVLATGLFTGRIGMALALVAAFSLGLAATVTAVGLAALWGRDRMARRLDEGRVARLARAVPLAAAVLVLAAGAVTAAMGVARLL